MIAVTVVVAAALAGGAEVNACVLCHPEERVQQEIGIHLAEGIDCTSCHGGDKSATRVERAHGKGYRGVLERRQIPELCASCHADVARMRPYNLPTDQLALYRTSQHGKQLEKGDAHVAVCTDCHGVHDIRRTSDPESRVHVRNIPQTCGRCHGDPALAERYGWKSNPYEDYKAGVHGQALLEKASVNAPTCSRCHGAHGATPPGVGDVDKVCGQCHPTTRAAFLEGPHKAGMDAEGLPECASCHGYHRVRASDPEHMAAVCETCHAGEEKPMATVAALKTLYVTAGDEIERARSTVTRAAAVPIYVEDYVARLEEARTLLVESATLMHSVDVAKVQGQTERSRAIAREIESELHRKLEQLRWRRAGVLIFWFYLALTIAILLRYRRRAAREAAH